MRGNTVVLGPPGTGKTTRLSRYIERGAAKFGSERVLVCSLTKTAATELTQRGLPIPRENVGTLHAICYRELGRPALVYPTLNEFNSAYGYNLSDQTKEHDDLDADDSVYAQYDFVRARRINKRMWPASVKRFARLIEDWKENTGTIDFTDMIEKAVQEVDKPKCNPRAIFYDEAQDGSRLELDLITKWSQCTDHTIIAGDDDQALFGWRGASVEAFLEFSDRHVVLNQSYRLPSKVKAYAERLAASIDMRAEKKFNAARDGGRVVKTTLALDRQMMPHFIPTVQKALENGTVMVLTSCGYMLSGAIKQLKAHGIPYHNPYRVKRGDWNPLRRGKKIVTATDRLVSFLRPALGDHWTWDDIWRFASILKARGIIVPGYKVGLKKRKGLPMKPSWNEFKAIFEPDALQRILAHDLSWYRQSVQQSNKAFDFPIKIAEQDPKMLTQKPRVIVGTIHSVKGGEADSVIVYPDLSHAAMNEMERCRDSILRTFYVAVTRARRDVYLCRSASTSAFPWI